MTGDSVNIPVIVAAGRVDGTNAGGIGNVSPLLSNDGGLEGVSVEHPADGQYVLRLLEPVDPARIEVTVSIEGSGGQCVAPRIDTSQAGAPVPIVTIYLTGV